MEKFRLPPEYKDFYHIKQEDLDRLNRHIEYFESQTKRRKHIRVWIFGGVILIVVVMFVVGIIDLSYFKSLFEGKTFLIKDNFKVGNIEVEVRVSMPKEGKINVILELSESFKEDIIISNRHDVRIVKIDDVGVVSMRYDNRIFVVLGESNRVINIERLKPME